MILGSTIVLQTINGNPMDIDQGPGNVTEKPSLDDPNFIFGAGGAFSQNKSQIAQNTLRNASI
jgi:hypothetical protein